MDKVAEVLSKLADQLGTTVEYLWAVLIRQARVSGWVDLGQDLLLLLATALWLGYLRKRKLEGKGYFNDPTTVFIIMSGAVMAVGWAVALTGVGWTVTKFVNPEFWALNRALAALGR